MFKLTHNGPKRIRGHIDLRIGDQFYTEYYLHGRKQQSQVFQVVSRPRKVIHPQTGKTVYRVTAIHV